MSCAPKTIEKTIATVIGGGSSSSPGPTRIRVYIPSGRILGHVIVFARSKPAAFIDLQASGSKWTVYPAVRADGNASGDVVLQPVVVSGTLPSGYELQGPVRAWIVDVVWGTFNTQVSGTQAGDVVCRATFEPALCGCSCKDTESALALCDMTFDGSVGSIVSGPPGG